MEKINVRDKFDLFSDHWTPKVIAELNDYQFKLVKIEGEFVWHDHPETDEVFIVVEGSMKIEFEDHTIELEEGEVAYPDPLPPGLDEFLVEDGGVLSCFMEAVGACDIDVIPPL